MGGLHIFTVAGNFLLVIGTHFDHRHLSILSNTQQSEGYAYVVVQVALCSIGIEMRSQHRRHQLLGSGLAIAARDRNKGYRKLTAMVAG